MTGSHAKETTLLNQTLNGVANNTVSLNDEYSISVVAEYLTEVVALDSHHNESKILVGSFFGKLGEQFNLSFETIEHLALLNLALETSYHKKIQQLLLNAVEKRPIRIDKVVPTLRYLIISDQKSAPQLTPVFNQVFHSLDICLSSFVLEAARCFEDLTSILPFFNDSQQAALIAIITEMKEGDMIKRTASETFSDIVLSKPL